MQLTLAEANEMIAGAIAKAEELSIKINISVVDGGARLLAFARMDGARWAGRYGSEGKAIASVCFGTASGQLAQRADSPIVKGILAAEGNHGIPALGAVPIIRDGVVDGACGVGGGTGEQDEECARAGIARIGVTA
jgi:uncharacterized protein GlcG (DUF336 family)